MLLCRPRGGFNDTLNQIHRCWDYARRWQRTLIIDTRWSGLLEPFDKYFELRRSNSRIHLSPTGCEALRPALLSDHPSLTGQSSGSTWDPSSGVYRDTETGEILTFDFSSDHPNELLVHEGHGGGSSGPKVLRKLRLTRDAALQVSDRLSDIPRPYTAIHVRNTDITSDYGAFIAEHAAGLSGHNIAIATDDERVRDHAEKAIEGARLLRLTTTPRRDGRKLHENPDVHRGEANTDLLFDLLMLASADRLLICPLSETGPRRSRMSGFSRLALQLHERPRLVRSLLAQAGRSRSTR